MAGPVHMPRGPLRTPVPGSSTADCRAGRGWGGWKVGPGCPWGSQGAVAAPGLPAPRPHIPPSPDTQASSSAQDPHADSCPGNNVGNNVGGSESSGAQWSREGGGWGQQRSSPSSGRLTEDTDQAQSWEARPQSRPQAKAARPLPGDPAPSRLPGSGLSGDTGTAPPGSLFQAPQTESPVTRRASRSAPPAPQAARVCDRPRTTPGSPRQATVGGCGAAPPSPGSADSGAGLPRLRSPPPSTRRPAGRSRPSGPQPLRPPPRPLPGASAPCRPLPARGAPTVRSGARWAGPGRAGRAGAQLATRPGCRKCQKTDPTAGAEGGSAGRRRGGRAEGRRARRPQNPGGIAVRSRRASDPRPCRAAPRSPGALWAPSLRQPAPRRGCGPFRKRGAGGDWGQPPG